MTAHPFLITGLPRSRTAWMSVLCTTGRAFCAHEPSAKFRTVDDIADFYDTDAYDYIGASDATLGLFLPWILEHIKPRVLIIDRPLEDCQLSFERAIGLPRTTLVEREYEMLQSLPANPLVKRVWYEHLDLPRVVAGCFFHLLPGLPFDEERAAELARLNIQVDPDKLILRTIRAQDSLRELLRDFLQEAA